MLDTGEPADNQKLKTYVHELFGHLGYDTIFDACEMIDGADILKALCLLKVVQQGHCDTCAVNKTRLPPQARMQWHYTTQGVLDFNRHVEETHDSTGSSRKELEWVMVSGDP
jgi:hypothetical protein